MLVEILYVKVRQQFRHITEDLFVKTKLYEIIQICWQKNLNPNFRLCYKFFAFLYQSDIAEYSPRHPAIYVSGDIR